MYAFHIDMNYAAFRMETLKHILELAASAGFDTILWEIEDKVCLETLGPSVHPDAMSKTDFKGLLAYAEKLHLRSCPLLQTLGHAEYVLKAPEHAALRENGSPDCYCTSSSEVKIFLKALIAEIADLFGNPPFFHLGGDEAYNYHTCGKCKAKPLEVLFMEHELELASILFERGIRPCFWADMLRHHPDVLEKFDRRFMIWLWDYAPDAKWEDAEKLQKAGYELVICPSSSSCQDSPFVSRWGAHIANIRSAAGVARTLPEPCLCMTSWSIRMGLKECQFPLWEFGRKVFLEGVDPDKAEAELRTRYFGKADPDALCRWNWILTQFSGADWQRYKNGLMPPPGMVAEHLKQYENGFALLAETVPQWLAEAGSAEKLFHADSRFGELVRRGGKLRQRFLDCVNAVLHGQRFPLEQLRNDEREFADFLSFEQTPESAAHNAALVYEPLIEYISAQNQQDAR